jgi:excinuclease ABC subunit A
MCHECNGLGTRPEMDPDLIVPDPSRSIRGGAVEPWNHALEKQGGWTFRMIESLASSFKVALDKPWKELPRDVKDLLLYGAGDETRASAGAKAGAPGRIARPSKASSRC